MTHVVHPYSFRLGILRNWKSNWFNSKKYKSFLKGDVLIREWLEKKMRGMYIDSIDIERSRDTFRVIVKTSRPGLVIGRKGENVEKFKKSIAKMFKKLDLEPYRKLDFTVEEVRYPESRAAIVSQTIAESLERRFPFRRVIKQTVEKVMMNKNVKGVKIALSGRLGGAEMSRREWLGKGKMPLQTMGADIDFAKERAHLPYGDVGIKVWIYREDDENNK
ncbi:30S ribosomal protein S3 [Patescibacteria group bacterium]|nr:30S ribosomal protein S3 [Patescibacteria group bacterium]MBU2633402.1 30S ribosomal protein S3 [Patescibacteria group bacterium]